MSAKLFFITLLIVGGLAIIGVTNQPKQENAISSVADQASSNNSIPTATLSPQQETLGAVNIEVTPIFISPGTNPVFKISLNTHSVDLDYDYAKIATLTVNESNNYKAIEWTGDRSGHHLIGELIFEPLPASTQTITLSLDGIDDQSTSFDWNL